MSNYFGIVLEIFRLPVPQHGIGSASFDTAGVMNVGPSSPPDLHIPAPGSSVT